MQKYKKWVGALSDKEFFTYCLLSCTATFLIAFITSFILAKIF